MTASTPASSRALSWAIALALGLSLAACSKDEAEPDAAAGTPPAAAQPAGPSAEEVEAMEAQEAAEAALAGLSIDELRSRGSQALREQRLYAPAGDNAMEYYLTLREKSEKPDASAESALIDLMPYAIIAAEQAIGREDFIEAERLRALVERTDAQTPALPRIKDSIAKGRAGVVERAEQEAERLAQREREADDGDGDTDHFECVSDGEGLPEDAQDFGAQARPFGANRHNCRKIIDHRHRPCIQHGGKARIDSTHLAPRDMRLEPCRDGSEDEYRCCNSLRLARLCSGTYRLNCSRLNRKRTSGRGSRSNRRGHQSNYGKRRNDLLHKKLQLGDVCFYPSPSSI